MAKSKNLEALLAKAKAEKRSRNIWDPDVGGSLCGTVRKMRWIPGSAKDEEGKRVKYLSLHVEDEAGTLWVVNCGMMLHEAFEEQGGRDGSEIAIVYHGSEKTSGGQLGIYSCAVSNP